MSDNFAGIEELRNIVDWANFQREDWWDPAPESGRKTPTITNIRRIYLLVTKVAGVDFIEDAFETLTGTARQMLCAALDFDCESAEACNETY